MTDKERGEKGLNILCFDGGGTRGLSSLVVLRELMRRINSKSEGSKSLEPYEHFDVIAGTGTGGISACMLGRLRMPIEKSIEEYAKMMENIFSEKKMNGPALYKGTNLQQALKGMIRGATGNEGEMMIEDEIKNGCKTAVFAMARHNLNTSIPVMFRSYKVSANASPDCTIWQALHATMAHPDLFKGIDIPDSSVPQSFIGGEIGCSNPLAHVLSEVNRIYPNHRVACIISIGAGHARMIQVPNPSRLRLFLRTQDVAVMKAMATDGERVAEEMAERFQKTEGVYFRLNVDQGVQDMKDGSWERLGETMEHTKAYLQRNETSQRMENAEKASTEMRSTLKTAHTAGQAPGASETEVGLAQPPTKLKRCPAPTPVYTGRKGGNAELINCITGNKEERRVGVVYGLGGVGKTQLVLNVIEQTRDEWKYVIFVDASSNATVEGDLKDFATANGIGNTYEDTVSWLESYHEPWLVVFDNADTPSTNIRQYIPGGRHGSILITTRLPDLAGLARGPGSVFHLSSMSAVDGLALLMKTARIEAPQLSKDDTNAAQELLKDFGCLALAIVHAGAYIAHSPGMSFTEYRALFLSQRQHMLEQYSELPASAKLDDYGKTVYTTWRMCYDQLKPESRTLLWLISHLHYADISPDIFKRAAENMNSHYCPFSPKKLESTARKHVEGFLSAFMIWSPYKCWDTVKFTNVMADLRLYSLIDFDRTNAVYSMHVLVQDWARTVIPQEAKLAIECSATLVALSIDWKADTKSLAFKRRLALHVTSFLELSQVINTNHAYYFEEVLWCAGQWVQQEKLLLQLLEEMKQEVGEDHKDTLTVMNDLATCYLKSERLEEAVQIQVQTAESSKRVLGELHPNTLVIVGNLADSYSRLGRLEEAKQLQIQVLGAVRRAEGENDPQTLHIMSRLAVTHMWMGELNEAEVLESQVLETGKRILGGKHPQTIDSLAGLARIYSRSNRWEESVSLLLLACTAAHDELGAEHPYSKQYLQWLVEAQNKRVF